MRWQEAEKQLMNALAEIFDNPVSVRVYPSFAAACTLSHALSCQHSAVGFRLRANGSLSS